MSPRPMKPPRITSRLLSEPIMARARRSARLEETVRAEEAARLAEMARRDPDEASPPPAPLPRHPGHPGQSEGSRSEASRTGPPAAPPPPPAEHKARHKRELSAETCAKITQARRGHPISAEARAKISQALKGRKVPAEARANMSQAHRGHKASPETRAKMSQAHRGHETSPETRAKIGRASRGHVVSAEHRAKMSRALRGERNPHYWHGAYCMPAQPVKSVEDVIADLSTKQARISALLDYHLDSGPELTPQVLTLFTLSTQIAGKLGQLLRYQESQADPFRDELEKAIHQALDEIAEETGLEL